MRNRQSTELMRIAGSVAVLVVLVAMVAAACGEHDVVEPRSFESTSRPIANGSKDDSHTAAVAFLVRKQAGQYALCSGTIVAPNLVLTAQHCVTRNKSAHIQCGQTEYGPVHDPSDFRFVSPDANLRTQSDKWVSSPDFSSEVEHVLVPLGQNEPCGDDIAALILAKKVPKSVTDPASLRLNNPASKGERFVAVGHGRDGEDQKTAGYRRKREKRKVKFRCTKKFCRPSVDGRKIPMGHGEFAASTALCYGDSGGGGYDDKERLFAIGTRTGSNKGKCGHSLYTGLYDWRQWIAAAGGQAAAVGGYQQPGWATGGKDSDGDGLFDALDNCPNKSNPKQEDPDRNGAGEACDDMDSDGDGIADAADNCPDKPNPSQLDFDADDKGDVCEDSDGDGKLDANDNCPGTANPDQSDPDGDGVGTVCDDPDGDGVEGENDNCPGEPNSAQRDIDGDGEGDACDDVDGDGVLDADDNCPQTKNMQQLDGNGNGAGDVCDDSDNDGLVDAEDNCPDTNNAEQIDNDGDGVGDACELSCSDSVRCGAAGAEPDAGGSGGNKKGKSKSGCSTASAPPVSTASLFLVCMVGIRLIRESFRSEQRD